MGLNNIQFSILDGNTQAQLPGKDHYSGLVVYATETAVLPSQFGSKEEMKQAISATASPVAFKLALNFFDKCPGGYLFISSTASTTDYSEMVTLQRYAQGQIRQFAVHNSAVVGATTSLTHTQAVQARLDDMGVDRAYSTAYLSVGITGSYTGLQDATSLACPRVGILYGKTSENLSMAGLALGVLASIPLYRSPANPQTGNLDTSYAEAKYLGDGTAVDTLSSTTLGVIADKGYLIPTRITGIAGHYLGKSVTAVSSASDFSTVQQNRVISKILRNCYTALVPFQDFETYTDASGKLTSGTIERFKSPLEIVLDQMKADGEISGYTVYIDPNQNVAGSKTLNITIKYQPVGSASTLSVTLSQTLTLAQ